jgi:hypothetical protein
LEERVNYAGNIVLNRTGGAAEGVEQADELMHLLLVRAERIFRVQTEFVRERNRGDEHAMVPIAQKKQRVFKEAISKLRDTANNAQAASGSLLADVWVGLAKETLNLRCEVTAHGVGGDVSKSAEGEGGDVLVFAAEVRFHGVGGHHEELVALVEEDHQPKVSDALVRVRIGGAEGDTLHLAEVSGVAEQVEEHKLHNGGEAHRPALLRAERVPEIR